MLPLIHKMFRMFRNTHTFEDSLDVHINCLDPVNKNVINPIKIMVRQSLLTSTRFFFF